MSTMDPQNQHATDPAAGVTVVIPSRNRRDLLLRTLHSVLAQRDVVLTVLVVDDCGDDGTDEAVRALDDPRVQVVRHETRRGVSTARNTGLALVVTPWVAFVDDDDLWSPDKLRLQLASIEADGSALWSCVGSVNIDREARVLWWADPLHTRDLSDALLTNNSIPGGGSGVLVATGLARAVGGFDDTMSNLADWDFYLRLAQRSPVAAVHAPLVGYLVHAGSMAHDIRRSMAEYRYMGIKYADLRSAHGVLLDEEPWLIYLTGMAYNGGRRLTGRATVPAAGTTTRPPSIVAFDGDGPGADECLPGSRPPGRGTGASGIRTKRCRLAAPLHSARKLAAPSCVTRPMSRDASGRQGASTTSQITPASSSGRTDSVSPQSSTQGRR